MRLTQCLFPLIIFASVLNGAEINTLKSAVENAKDEGKFIYLSFVGSDWSVASKKWSEEILDSSAFKSFAEENLVLLELDARRKPPLKKLERAELQAMVIEFDIKTYPTFILLSSNGLELHRHGYLEVSAEEYTNALGTLISE